MIEANQVRINELARELEVKAKAIIDLLPGYGVTEKKTHSSSIPEDVAEKVRKNILGQAEAEAAAEAAAKADSAAKEAAARAARMRPAAPAAPVAAPPIAAKPPAPAAVPGITTMPAPAPSSAAPVARPIVPAAPAPPAPVSTAPAVAPAAPKPPSPVAPISAPAVVPPAAKPPAPVSPAPTSARPPAPTPIRPPSPTGHPTSAPSGPRPTSAAPSGQRPHAPAGAQPGAIRSAAAAPGARPAVPSRPLPTGNRGPVPGTTPGSGQRTGGPRPGQPMRPPQGGGQGRPYSPRPGGPGGTGSSPANRPFDQRRGAIPTGTRPGPRQPGRPGMLPALPPDRVPPKAEPGKPLYTRKPTQRQRPVMDKREQEGERKLHPTRQRPGAGDRRSAAAVIAPPEPRAPREVTITEGITIRELAEKLDVRAKDLLKTLLDRGVFASINQALDVPTATTLAETFSGVVSVVSLEEEMVLEVAKEETKESLKPRPPVVTVMGHVDHGKTSLLDAIRSADVADGEAGGITQHIGAYKVVVSDRSVVFVDTPGHEAFTRMRSRGAKVTDIVVLVVAADDGVMPQTKEAIDHAKAAKVPIIVAINKMDAPGATPERIKQQLSDRGLLAEDWGGDVVMVPVSAKAKTNLDLLLEMILLVADILDLKANPARPAMGTVLEAKLDRGRGPVATVLVRNGTLRVGDYMICGSVFGRVRAMVDDHGENTREVGPSMPAEVQGLESLPDVGDTMQVVTDTAKAKQIVIYRESKAREVAMAKNKRLTLDQFHDQLKEGEVKDLNIILKTDVGGTAEVISDTLTRLSTDKVRIRVMRAGVGAITETDVLLASASNAIIVGFNVRPDRTAQSVAEQEKVDVRLHSIIYELVDQIKKAMSGMLDPVFKEVFKGRAVVQDVFRISKVGAVAGCVVQDGSLVRNGEVRVLRDGVLVHTGKIEGLKRFKNDASEVKAGFECGISLANFNDVKEGDVFECFATERVAQEALV